MIRNRRRKVVPLNARNRYTKKSGAITVTVTNNLFKHELQKSPALPPSSVPGLFKYADLFRAPLPTQVNV
jgi:hypothetical protein